MFVGKLIGGLLGLLVAGPIGLALGLLVGHWFDRSLGGMGFASQEQAARVQHNFFETTFLLAGYLAKADGRVSEPEIAHTEAAMAHMGLTPEHRRQAIELFQRGAAADFHPEPAVAAFMRGAGSRRILRQTLLLFLISLALADQRIDAAEQQALQRIATPLGVSPAELERLWKMVQAQSHFQGGRTGTGAPPRGDRLKDAYAALGVSPKVDDATLKRAYRKLMSENHPDKLIARGVPEDMIRLATERSQEISTAYELIRKSRA